MREYSWTGKTLELLESRGLYIGYWIDKGDGSSSMQTIEITGTKVVWVCYNRVAHFHGRLFLKHEKLTVEVLCQQAV